MRRLVLIAGGLAWLTRAVIGLYGPAYWSPRTWLDYVAVAGTSLGLLLLGLGLWSFHRAYAAPPGRARTIWSAGIALACASSFTVGVSNFVEDALRVRALGIVWVIGALVLLAGLLIAGLGALWLRGLPRRVGVLLLVCAAGLLFTEWNGLIGLGLALLALGLTSVAQTGQAEIRQR
jgi:hypothetical protein